MSFKTIVFITSLLLIVIGCSNQENTANTVTTETLSTESDINVKITAPKFGATTKIVHLTWDANPEPDLAGYKLYYGDTPRPADVTGPDTITYPTSVDIPDPQAISYQISLPLGAYFFALTAYDTSANESEFSNEAFATLLDAPTSFDVSFKWDMHPQANIIDGFKIYYGATSRGSVSSPYEAHPYTDIITAPGPMLASLSTTLSAGDYYFSLTAYNNDNPVGYKDSAFSNEIFASIGSALEAFPKTPDEIVVIPII